jgi:hypothetical protein
VRSVSRSRRSSLPPRSNRRSPLGSTRSCAAPAGSPALTGAEQAALKLWVGEDPSQARKYFSLSKKYAAFRDFRVDPKGYGLHGMTIPPGEVVSLTEAEVLAHPLYHGFGQLAPDHPPMRGWLARASDAPR